MRRHAALTIMCAMAYAHSTAGVENVDTVDVLSEVVVTGNAAGRQASSAAPLRLMDQQQMLRGGVADVSEALHRMPGVNLRDYGGAGGLKTVSVRGFGAAHTGVFYDGVPLSDVQSGQIDLSRYSIDNVGSVGMVVGDNDDIFIPARLAASAATVSISSLPVLDKPELSVKMRAGSWGYCNPFLRVGAPMGESAAANFVGEFTHADNDYPFTLRNGELVTKEKRTNSRMNSGHGEANLLWHIGDKNILTAKAYYYNNSRQLPGPVIYYNNASNEHLKEENALAQAQLRSSLAPSLTLNAIAKFNYAVSKYHDENGKYPGGQLNQNYWQREYYASCALLWAPAGNWLFDYSGDYFFNNLNSNLASDNRPYRHSVLQSLTAKYRSGRVSAMARALVSVYRNGAQRGVAAKSASKVSPSVSLSYQPVAGELWFVRASYKNIFRMPTFNEAYFDHYGSADILPESTGQINIGTTYTARAHGILSQSVLTVDAYANNIRDMIVAMPYNMFVWRMVNLGKVHAYGIDVTAEAVVAPRKSHALTFMAAYGYQRAMSMTNPESSEWKKQVAYIPEHSGSASISYENPWVNVSFSGTGVSHRFSTNNNVPSTRIAGYVECNVTVWRDFSFRSHRLGLRLDAQNIFNKQYYIVARYPMPGRQFKITLSFDL